MDNMDNKLAAGGGTSKLAAGGGTSQAGSAKSYKGGATPQTPAEANMLKELAATDPGYIIPVRHDRSAAPKDKEFKFLSQKDGSHELSAINRGISRASLQMEQIDKASASVKTIKTVEDSWGIHTKFVESGYVYDEDSEISGDKKFLSTRSISISNDDASGAKDPNILLLTTHDIKDNRAARADRLKQFSEVYGGEIVNISRAVASKAILLDDDEVLHEFVCKKIVGLPSGVWSGGKSEWSGKIIVSLIKNNKYGRLRFHFSVAEASVKFEAKETYYSKVFGEAFASLTGASDAKSSVDNDLSVSYQQVSAFSGGDCSIPIPAPMDGTHTFGSCYAYRKASKKLTVTGKGYQTAYAGSLKTGVQCGCDNCYILACAEQIRKNPDCNLFFEIVLRLLCLKPCFPCCKPEDETSEAKVDITSAINYEVSDSWVLGGPQNTWSETSLHPTKATTAERHPVPLVWQPMCCCLLQYKGHYTPCRCFTSRPDSSSDHETGINESPAVWEVSKQEQDDIYLEFKYKSIKGSEASSDTKIVMLLDTVDKDSSTVYDQARKMVSVIGIEYGELYNEYEKAQQKKNAEREEKKQNDAKAKAKKEKEEKEKEEEEERLKREKEIEREEARALSKEKTKFERENEIIFIQESTKAAIEKNIQKRAEDAEAFSLKKLERELKEANKDRDYLSYINFLKERSVKGEPNWDGHSQKMEVDISNFFSKK